MDIKPLVVYQNNHFIVVNKPPAIPVQPDKENSTVCLQHMVHSFCKTGVYVVHRIDQPVSGLVIFAKHKGAMSKLSRMFQDRLVQKTYLAVVADKPEKDSDRLVQHIGKQGKSNRSVVKDSPFEGSKEAILEYKLIGQTDRYFLLEVKIETGRHHQIRAQLAALGSPIKGDVKYGARRSNKDKSIHLHAWKLVIPSSNAHEPLVFVANLPDDPIWNALPV